MTLYLEALAVAFIVNLVHIAVTGEQWMVTLP